MGGATTGTSPREVDRDRGVLTASRPSVLVPPTQHRPDVVRRLLDLGLSPSTLCLLLPGWVELIDRESRRR